VELAWAGFCNRVGFLFALLVYLGSAGYFFWTFGAQVLGWLNTAVWETHSIVDVLHAQGSTWAMYPEEWVGLHKVLDFIHAGFATGVCGATFAASLFKSLSDQSRELERRRAALKESREQENT
jgi:hypothetical protein